MNVNCFLLHFRSFVLIWGVWNDSILLCNLRNVTAIKVKEVTNANTMNRYENICEQKNGNKLVLTCYWKYLVVLEWYQPPALCCLKHCCNRNKKIDVIIEIFTADMFLRKCVTKTMYIKIT